MYRGTLETGVDADGAFVIGLPDSGADLMRRDPYVERFEAAGSEQTPASMAVAPVWKLGEPRFRT
jgi:hypothetical protein